MASPTRMPRWLRTAVWLAKATFVARSLPAEEISATVLAHLAVHGRTRTYELWQLFDDVPVDFDTLRVDRAKRFVSLGKLYSVLGGLREGGEIYGIPEVFEGRRQTFWNLNTLGGKRARGRTGEPAIETQAGGLVPAR